MKKYNYHSGISIATENLPVAQGAKKPNNQCFRGGKHNLTFCSTEIFWWAFVNKIFLNCKLDGVAPLITDRPPTIFTTLSEENQCIKKKEKNDMLHVTHDM